MELSSPRFKIKVADALGNKNLQHALGRMQTHFVDKRTAAVQGLSVFDQVRDNGAEVRDRVLQNLGGYLQRFEKMAQAAGATVHWAETPEEAGEIISRI